MVTSLVSATAPGKDVKVVVPALRKPQGHRKLSLGFRRKGPELLLSGKGLLPSVELGVVRLAMGPTLLGREMKTGILRSKLPGAVACPWQDE